MISELKLENGKWVSYFEIQPEGKTIIGITKTDTNIDDTDLYDIEI